jgi:UDP-glucose 6-dehydrogenase
MFYFKVVYVNVLYDWCQKLGIDYEAVKSSMAADPRIGAIHIDPIHKSGRGAGGSCFIKDFEAFRRSYKQTHPDDIFGNELLAALVRKNMDLLHSTNKDEHLIKGVYGEEENIWNP